MIAPRFGGINLEDISAPRCFEIENKLKEKLNIPVFHDDQHGTAIVVLSGIINALRIVDKKKEDLNKQKSYTKNTLDAFLSDNTSKNLQSNFGNLSNFVEGNNSTLLDISSRMSDNMSHNNLSYNNNNINNSVQNEISMNVFTHFEPTKDGKIYRPQKKKINLKDFIFLLENSTEYIPNKILLLNKAAIDNTKNK